MRSALECHSGYDAQMSSKYVLFALTSTLALPSLACSDDVSGTDDSGETEHWSDGEDEAGHTDPSATDSDSSGDGDGDEGGDGDGDEDTTPPNPLPDAPVGEWSYVEIEGMQCRDGSPAGVAVRYAENTDLLGIYFQGGGACFNELTCLQNPSSINPSQFDPGPSGGLFDAENPDNPLMDYNWIFVPYCTGDAFIGSKPDGDIPLGPQGQQFVGHPNLALALDRIVDTFPDLADVFLTGESGGGFGAASNYDFIASHFPNNDVNLVDDSGPIFRDQYLAPCLQQQWRDVWNLSASLPEDCEGCFNADGGGLANYWTHISTKYPSATKGLISSHQDSVISLFFGFGTNDCGALFPTFPEFEPALYDLRDNVLTSPDYGTFYMAGDTHTYLSKQDYYTLEVGGVVLSDWVADIIAGEPSHVAP